MTEAISTPHQCTEAAFGAPIQQEIAQMPSPSEYLEFEQRLAEVYQTAGAVAVGQTAHTN